MNARSTARRYYIRQFNFAHAVVGLVSLVGLLTWWPEYAWAEVACPNDFSLLLSSETLFRNAGAVEAGVDIDDDDKRRLTSVSLTSVWEPSSDYQLPEKLGAAYDLAILMITFGEMREAEARMKCILQQAQMQYGTSHESYAGVLGTLAAIVQIQGRYSAARKMLQQCLSILDETRGSEHILKVRPLTLLGLGFHAQGDDAAAVSYYQHALRIIEKNMRPAQKDAETWRALIEEASQR